MLVKLYDKEGKEQMKESVDARECIENLGWTTSPPEGFAVVEEEVVVENPYANLNAAALRGLLDQRNITYATKTTVTALRELLDADDAAV